MNNSDALRETCLIMYPIASYASSYIVSGWGPSLVLSSETHFIANNNVKTQTMPLSVRTGSQSLK